MEGGDADRVRRGRLILSDYTEKEKMDILLIQQDLQKSSERVRTSETRLGEVEDVIPQLQTVSDGM